MFSRRGHIPSTFALVTTTSLLLLGALASACGGKVVVDVDNGDGGASGTSSSGGISTGTGDPTLQCGEEPAEGKIVAVCVTMGGDSCPPAATSPGLLQTLSDVMGVCAKNASNNCCNQPALVQVVCDLPPSGNECCYHVHYFETLTCP